MKLTHGHVRIAALFWFVLGVFIVQPLYPESLSSRLSGVAPEHSRELRANQTVQRDVESWRDVALIPQHPLSREIEKQLDEARPNVLSERLTLVERGISDAEFLELYNSLRRVSVFDEIEYYNWEKDKWHPLFGESYRIAEESSTTALPDPVVRRIPAQDHFLVLQDLMPFGNTVSRYRYERGRDAFLFVGTNLTRIRYKGFPVVGPEEMVSAFLVMREPDYTLVYGVGGANVFNMLGLLSGMIETPFAARTTGLFEWYSENYLLPLRRGELVPRNS